MTGYSIAQIAAAIDAEAVGEISLTVTQLTEPRDAGPDDLALASNPKYAESLSESNAVAALMWHGADWQSFGLKAALLPRRPRFAMSGLTAMYDPGQGADAGIHPTALIDPSADIGAGASIGPYTVVAAETKRVSPEEARPRRWASRSRI